jgi:ankyrin repeat protein
VAGRGQRRDVCVGGMEWQNGMRALHWASYGGHMEVVRELVDAKADLTAVDEVRR